MVLLKIFQVNLHEIFYNGLLRINLNFVLTNLKLILFLFVNTEYN